eukprot:3024868-Amphidinium_carterae.1
MEGVDGRFATGYGLTANARKRVSPIRSTSSMRKKMPLLHAYVMGYEGAPSMISHHETKSGFVRAHGPLGLNCGQLA